MRARAEPIAPGSIVCGHCDRYRIGARIGQGGIGDVWRATALSSGRQVAVKTLSPHRFELTDAVFERFRREIVNGSSLDHPNLVRLLDHDAEGTPLFLVMELVPGRLLSGILADLSSNERISIAEGVVDGLQRIHAAGFVHRDLKTNNIIVTPEGRPVILDYGLLKKQDGDAYLTDTTDKLGSLLYTSSRHQRDPASAGPRDDVYSVLACMFEVFSGHRMSLRWQGTPLRYGSTRLQRVIAGVLSESLPEDRWPSLTEVRDLVGERRTSRAGSGGHHRVDPPPGPAVRPQLERSPRVSWSPGGQYLAMAGVTAGEQAVAHVWARVPGEHLGSLLVGEEAEGVCRSFSWSADGTVLLASTSSSVAACTAPDLRFLFEDRSTAIYNNIAMSPGGDRLCWGNVFGTTALVDTGTGDYLHRAQLHPGAASLSVGFWWSPGGDYVLVQSGARVQVWDGRRGDLIAVMDHYCTYEYSECALEVSWLGPERFAVVTHGGGLLIGTPHGEYSDTHLSERLTQPEHSYPPPTCLATHRDRIAFYRSGALELWDAGKAKRLDCKPVEIDESFWYEASMRFSDDGRKIVLATSSGLVQWSNDGDRLGEMRWLHRELGGQRACRVLGWDALGSLWAVAGGNTLLCDGPRSFQLLLPSGTSEIDASLVDGMLAVGSQEVFLVDSATLAATVLAPIDLPDGGTSVVPRPARLEELGDLRRPEP